MGGEKGKSVNKGSSLEKTCRGKERGRRRERKEEREQLREREREIGSEAGCEETLGQTREGAFTSHVRIPSLEVTGKTPGF